MAAVELVEKLLLAESRAEFWALDLADFFASARSLERDEPRPTCGKKSEIAWEVALTALEMFPALVTNTARKEEVSAPNVDLPNQEYAFSAHLLQCRWT